MSGSWAVVSAAVLSCSAPAAAPGPAPTVPAAVAAKTPPTAVGLAVSTARLDADTPLTTASGAAFEAPKGWFYTTNGDVIVLENPERDVALTLIEVADAGDASKAVHTAWTRIEPGFRRQPKQTTEPPPRDGWDAITQIAYETGGAEERTVFALARRKGTTHYVALVNGTNSGLDRRGAQLLTVLSTFKAPGVEEESLAGRSAHVLDAERSKLLEQFIVDSMSRAKVPGAAIAIVQGGKLAYHQAFGVRELGKKAPVTPNTLFMIGSTTKSLTTLMMAKLVDERKFGWETPVNRLLPTFALADPDVTGKLLVKHTVCACTGLPRQDMELLFEFTHVTPEQRLEAMRSMRPSTGFGETFQYSNTMVAAGGYVAAHALDARRKLGAAYDAAMQTRVFVPLGMTSTTLDFAVVRRREHAMPHATDIESNYEVLPLASEEGVVGVRPAGGAWSNVRDMSRYLLLELTQGRDRSGKQLISQANLLKRREPQIKITDKKAYGLGLFVENDHGVELVHHSGNNLGFTSDMFFVPQHGVGVVLLTNASNALAFRRAVRRRILELLFDAKQEAAENLGFALASQQSAVRKELERISIEPEEAWSKGLAGRYQNATLGLLTVSVEGGSGILDVGEWRSAFGKRQGPDGTVQLVLLDPPLAGLEFRPGEKAGRKVLTLDAGQQTYEFELRSPGTASTASKQPDVLPSRP